MALGNLTAGTPSLDLPEGFIRTGVVGRTGDPVYESLYAAVVAASPSWVPVEGSEPLTPAQKLRVSAAVRHRSVRDFGTTRHSHQATDGRDGKLYIKLTSNEISS